MNTFLQGNAAGSGTFIRRLGGRRLTVPVNFQPTSGPYKGTCDYRHQPVPCRISLLGGEPNARRKQVIATVHAVGPAAPMFPAGFPLLF